MQVGQIKFNPPICPYCGSVAMLKSSAEVLGRDLGPIWDCRPCDAYVGVHNGNAEKPKGTLANRELRYWRMRAHKAFDWIWLERRLRRHEAYLLLMQKLYLAKSQAYIGKFTVEQCRETVRIFSILRNESVAHRRNGKDGELWERIRSEIAEG